MRRWLLLVMVLLLPLRGWVGEAMAAQMLQQHVAAAESMVATAGAGHQHANPAASAHHDCDEHAASAPVDDGKAEAKADCPTCSACQVCSSVALSPYSAAPPAAAVTQPRPQTVPHAHASAEPLLAFKPPKS
jgi:hypothetical protein